MELQELELSIADYIAEAEVDPSEFHALEERINTFETLKRKYGLSLEDVLAHADKARTKLHSLDNRDALMDELRAKLAELEEQLVAAGANLSAKRKKVAPRLAKDIAGHLRDLGFKQAAFELLVNTHKKPQASGLESVDFQFGPNPGEPLKPLRNIASSGEMSRVMLAAKSALAKQDDMPLMVFDEIDANVGGEIARAVGEKMAVLGKGHQVISITHFPQVAAVASQHFVVKKMVEGGRTISELNLVEGDDRVSELVRMLGGGTGKEAQEMAKSLLLK
jgi:DNA repair protein RecN (Recombination protein N)